MGRDIYVDSKHLNYYGSKSSDLIMAFDRFFIEFPRCNTDEDGYYDVELSIKEMGQVLEFIKEDVSLNSKLYKNANELLERMNNVYIRMTPKDFVRVWTC